MHTIALRAPNIMKHTLRCHGIGDAGQAARSGPATGSPNQVAAGQNRASPRGLRPESPLALSRGLPIQRVLAAPRFALSTILTRNARAFHYVRRSKARPCPSRWCTPGICPWSRTGRRSPSTSVSNQDRLARTGGPRPPRAWWIFGTAFLAGYALRRHRTCVYVL